MSPTCNTASHSHRQRENALHRAYREGVVAREYGSGGVEGRTSQETQRIKHTIQKG